jgi:peptidoglycan/xylan/chitin deacetylase (PgdA/CDA1 family)
MKPTWLTNWEMAVWPAFQELGRSVIAAGTGEVGMHLHAWNSPPIVELTHNDHQHHPYLIEYPRAVIREKIKVMTDVLQSVFGTKMVSHRAGRWSFNETYAQALIEHGYRVDCSVTPHVSWQGCKGNPEGNGGTDFSDFPEQAYLIDPQNIRSPGSSKLLEVPLSVRPIGRSRMLTDATRLANAISPFAGRIARRLFPPTVRLMPNGRNRNAMIELIDDAVFEGRDYVEFMLHSSELMPGGSPTFATSARIERLYRDIELLFAHACSRFQGRTLSEYYDQFISRMPQAVGQTDDRAGDRLAFGDRLIGDDIPNRN